MATYRLRPSGTVEAIIRRKQLPGPVSLTFETMEKAEAYCQEAEAILDAGGMPPGLLERAKHGPAKHDAMKQTIADIVRSYKLEYAVKADDIGWLDVIVKEEGETRIDAVTVQWAADVVRRYKIVKHLKPATIRHRIGALRRCLDWAVTMKKAMPLNPLRLLPERYAVYNESEAKVLAAEDIDAPDSNNERDRRLEPGEEPKIRKVLARDPEYLKTVKAERSINEESAAPMLLLFEMAIETAMRLREMFTLEVEQINLGQRTAFLDRTKNGSKRQVPLSSVIVRCIEDYLKETGITTGRLFPMFWNGDLSKRELKKTTSKLSGRWRTVAKLARCVDLRFHDLRHEATARLYERTTMSDLKIAKITGHKDLKSLARYANLRASNLADEMW